MAFREEDTLKYIEMAAKFGLNLEDENDMRDFVAAVRYNDYQLQNMDKRLSTADASEAVGLSPAHITRIRTMRKNLWGIALKIVMADFLSDEARRDRRHAMLAAMTDLYADGLRHALEISAGKVRNERGELLPDSRQPHFRERVAAFREVSGSRIAQFWLETQFLGDVQSPEEADHLQMKASLVQRAALRLDAPIEAEIVEAAMQPPAQTSPDPLPVTQPLEATDSQP